MPKKKKIIFIIPSLKSGGAERVTLNYLRQLSLKKYLIKIIIFENKKDLRKLILKGVIIKNLKTLSASNSFFKILKNIKKIKPDFIFTSHSRVAAVLFFVKPFVNKFKHIARMINMPSQEKKYNIYGSFKRWIFSKAFKDADIVIAQTHEMKNDGIKTFGLAKNKIRVMYNPINKTEINQYIKNTSSPFSSKEIAAVASGRLSYQKDFTTLIKATIIVLKKYPDFKLYILGRDDGQKKILENMIIKNKLDKNIFLKGYQKNPYKYYKFCNLFILSSRFEGFPNVIIENYYLNTPIVTTNCVSVIKEFIKDKKNGYICEKENMISLSIKIKNCIKNLKRKNINNASYIGSRIEEVL